MQKKCPYCGGINNPLCPFCNPGPDIKIKHYIIDPDTEEEYECTEEEYDLAPDEYRIKSIQ